MDSLGFGLDGPDANVRKRRGGGLVKACDTRISLELDAVDTGNLTRRRRASAVLNIAVALGGPLDRQGEEARGERVVVSRADTSKPGGECGQGRKLSGRSDDRQLVDALKASGRSDLRSLLSTPTTVCTEELVVDKVPIFWATGSLSLCSNSDPPPYGDNGNSPSK